MSNLAADTTIPSSSPEYHFSFKVVVLGDGAVGKTALLQKEVGSVNTAHSRVGVNFFRKYYRWSKKTYRIEYWDCPGSLRYAPLISRYCAGASAAVLVFDPNNKSTFQNLNQWRETIERCSPALKIVIGNQFSRNPIEVTNEEAQSWADKYSMDYISANPYKSWDTQQNYTTPNEGVFQQIFAILTRSIPRVPEASLLLKKGVLLGSKLLNDYTYQKTLFQRTNKHSGPNPFVRTMATKKSRSNRRVDKTRRYPKNRLKGSKKRASPKNHRQSLQTLNFDSKKSYAAPLPRAFDFPDEHIDCEGLLPDRTEKETELLSTKDTFKKDYAEEMKTAKISQKTKSENSQQGLSKQTNTPLLVLEHVYGSNSKHVRKNVRYTTRGKIVYTAGINGLELDPVSKKQTFFKGYHCDEILSMAIFHASGRVEERPMFSRDIKQSQEAKELIYNGYETLIATGELGSKPSIYIWESNSMKYLSKLCGLHSRGVILLDFNKTGNLLASIGADNEHTLAVYDWQSRECVCSSPTSIDKVYCVRFLPEPSGMIVSAGIKHVYFWEPSHKDLVVTKSSLPMKESQDHITIVDIITVNGKKIIGAAAQGHLCVWDRKKVETMVSFESGSVKNAHPGGIACIHTNRSQDVIISGGSQGSIKLWNTKLSLLGTYSTHVPLSLDPGIRSLDFLVEKTQQKLLVATRGNEIFEIAIKEKKSNYSRNDFGTILHNGRALSVGHSGKEVWGLACNPVDPCIFATCGDDCTVRIWHTRRKKQINITEEGVIPTSARTVDFSSDGKSLAVGLGGIVGERRTFGYATHAGKVLILNFSTLEVEAVNRHAKEMISQVRFSPDSSFIAAASLDTNVYLYQFSRNGLYLSSVLKAHLAPVLHIDFSAEGRMIRTNDYESQLKYWDTYEGVSLEGSEVSSTSNFNSIKNVKWSTITCPSDPNCAGIWNSTNATMDDIRSIDFRVSNSPMNRLDGIVAVANDYGLLQIYKSPCNGKSKIQTYRGHTVRLTNVKFTCDGKKLISVGGLDRCIMQWHIGC